MMATHVLTSLVGIPYVPRGRGHDGADCWGVCLLAARELLGVQLPEYFYEEQDILVHACNHIGRETRGPHWRALANEGSQPGTIHIFRIRGFEVHCGMELGGGEFLHSLPGRNSCIERLSDLSWEHRRTGSYAWTP